ncbi:MAG TPA: hypothetical protein VGC71_10580 [Gaiellales bacterium]|jgi:hypothetical protein
MIAVVAGLVLLPAVTFAVAKSRPHRAPPPAPHVRPHPQQTAPALSI